LNQLNQSNVYYTSLRAQANEHGDQMAKCFHESHEAYNRRDGALAKQLSNEGKEHQRKMEEYNRQASDWIFRGSWLSSNNPIHLAEMGAFLENNRVCLPRRSGPISESLL
jgi:hypothetical protein